MRSNDKIPAVTDNATTAFEDRLHRVAVDFILPTGLDVNMAVTLAEDMVASGAGGAATVAVATLARDSLVSDARSAGAGDARGARHRVATAAWRGGQYQ